jgi:hypothetical protein
MRARWGEQRRARAELERAQETPRRTLASAVDEGMGVTDPTDELRFLSRLCFGGGPSYTNLDGSFERLRRELRERIVAEARGLLKRAEPSAVPAVGESFFSRVMEDAAAFEAAVFGTTTRSGSPPS